MLQIEGINNFSTENEKEKNELILKLRELKHQNDDLNRKFKEIKKHKDEQEKFTHLLEKEKNDLNNTVKGLMLQIEGINNFSTENEKEKNELILKLGELKHQNDDLNRKFKEIKKHKDEQEKFTHLLEKEKNDLNNKINELEKQKEEIIKSNENQKLIAETKVHSFENKIHELEIIQKNELDEIQKLEKEKNEIKRKLTKLTKEEIDNKSTNEKVKKQMIAKLKELENLANILEVEKSSMNNQIKELTKQKKEQENYAHSLELQNNEMNKKLELLIMKQEEDLNNKINQKVDNEENNHVEEFSTIINTKNIHDNQGKINEKEENNENIENKKNTKKNEKEKNIGNIDINKKDDEDENPIVKNKEIKRKCNQKTIKNTHEKVEKETCFHTIVDDCVFMQLEVSEEEDETSFSDDNEKSNKIHPPNQPNNDNSPRSKKNYFHTYDPSIFYSTVKRNKPQKAIHNLVKNPIKLNVTLKDIGLNGLDSPKHDKTVQLNAGKSQKIALKNKKQTNFSKSHNRELSLNPINKIKKENDVNCNQHQILDDSSDDSYDLFIFDLSEIEDDFSPQKQQDDIKNKKNALNCQDKSFPLNLKISEPEKKLTDNQALRNSPRKKKGSLYYSCLPELKKH